jgi:large subunit ribosomal protein L10
LRSIWPKKEKHKVTKEEKSLIIENLYGGFNKSEAIVFCDYKGIKCKSLEELRLEANKQNISVQVIKNTLAELSLKKCNINDIKLEGSNIALWGEDQISVAKTVSNFTKSYETFIVKYAAIEGEVSSAEHVEALSKLHSKEELLGMLASVWMGPLRGLVTGIDNLRTKKEEN